MQLQLQNVIAALGKQSDYLAAAHKDNMTSSEVKLCKLSQVLKEMGDPIVVHAKERYSRGDFPAATRLLDLGSVREYLLFPDEKLLK